MLRSGAVALLVLAWSPAVAKATLAYQRPATRAIVGAHDDGTHGRVVARGSYALISPDGKRLVFAVDKRHGRDLRMVATRGGKSRLLMHSAIASPSFPDINPHWSPDGRYVIAGSSADGDSYIFDVVHHTRRAVGLLVYAGAGFAPDSRRLALAVGDLRSSALRIYSLKTRRSRSIGDGSSPVWGSRGLAFARDSGLFLERHPGSEPKLLVPASTSFFYPVGWSAPGSRLLAAEGDTEFTLTALLVNPATGGVVRLSPAFSEVDGISRAGNRVLGVVGGDVVTVSGGGATRVLARSARSPSWTR